MQTRTAFSYTQLSDKQKQEIRLYGYTERELKEVVSSALDTGKITPSDLATRMLTEAQEMVSCDAGDQDDMMYDVMLIEDVRQMLNRVKWLISSYPVVQ